jgi:decaprenylphospho-beta-D-ribofuranose 2-oxidase
VKKIKISSWGNINKNISLDNSIDSEVSMLDIGNLNSYGDACIPKNVLSKSNKSNRTKETLFDYQASTVNYLYGTPGKSNVTIAGAIASDTHGKDNDWGGSFYKNVEEIKLRVDDKVLILNNKENKELFDATIGGYGLTGSITDVSLIDSNIPVYQKYNTEFHTGNGIDSLISSFKTKEGDYWVGWINLLDKRFQWVTKKSMPQGKYIKGVNKKAELQLPISLGFVGKGNMYLLKYVNSLYFNKFKNSKDREVSYFDTFYPLSFLTDSRNISYKRKIVQIQFSLPLKNEDKLNFLICELIKKQKPLLCSIKKLGPQNIMNNLSFFQNGWTIAVDFSYKEFNRDAIKLFYKELIKQEGKIYLAKDSDLDEECFKLMYPEYSEWKNIVKEVDPKNLYQSELSSRLGLKKW